MHNPDWLRRTSDAACKFWFLLTPFDLETVFREQFAPLIQLLFPDDSLLGTGVPQDFSRIKSDEGPRCPKEEGSPFRVPCYRDEPFCVFPRSPCNSIITFIVALSSIPFGTLGTLCAVSAVECSNASYAVPDLLPLHLVWGRISLETSALH